VAEPPDANDGSVVEVFGGGFYLGKGEAAADKRVVD